MNFNHLYHFHLVAQNGSLKRASEACGLSQSTLSEQMRQLEDYFGTPLFERKAGALRLSAGGRRMRVHTARIFDAAEGLQSAFAEGPPAAHKLLQIGVTSSVCRPIIARHLAGMFRDRSFNTRVRSGNYEFLLNELVTSGLEILVTDQPPEVADDSGVEIAVLQKAALAAVAAPQVAARIGDAGAFPQNLGGTELMTYTPHSPPRWIIDQFLAAHHVEARIVLETDDTHVLGEVIREGAGAGFVPEPSVRREVLEGELVELGRIDEPLKIYGVYVAKDPSPLILEAIAKLSASL
ncbi:N/A [soil metagenome]